MTHNDKILLNEILKQRQKAIAPTLAESEFFELFAAEQILRNTTSLTTNSRPG